MKTACACVKFHNFEFHLAPCKRIRKKATLDIFFLGPQIDLSLQKAYVAEHFLLSQCTMTSFAGSRHCFQGTCTPFATVHYEGRWLMICTSWLLMLCKLFNPSLNQYLKKSFLQFRYKHVFFRLNARTTEAHLEFVQ